MKKKLQHYFATYEGNEVFSTSDEFLFHRKHDAIAHANTLADKNVGDHKREDYPAGKEVKLPTEEEVKAQAEKEAAKAEKERIANEKKQKAEAEKADKDAKKKGAKEATKTSLQTSLEEFEQKN